MGYVTISALLYSFNAPRILTLPAFWLCCRRRRQNRVGVVRGASYMLRRSSSRKCRGAPSHCPLHLLVPVPHLRVLWGCRSNLIVLKMITSPLLGRSKNVSSLFATIANQEASVFVAGSVGSRATDVPLKFNFMPCRNSGMFVRMSSRCLDAQQLLMLQNQQMQF